MNKPADSAFAGTLVTIFLDRDGVINAKQPEGSYVTRWEEFQLLPGVPQSIARLNRAGIRVIVVSNQRGVALGLYTAADVEAIHTRLQQELADHGARIDAFYFCPHDKNSCECRKPLPGMFEQAQRDFPSIDAASSAMIGDSTVDVEFGRRVGMRTIFIDGDPALQKPGTREAGAQADTRFPSLADAVDALLDKH
ncbi:MAG: HAD family hydrolase [Terracidiphilus sp.]|nr:HAD family hydrolase [Terracidiphilus sp.]